MMESPPMRSNSSSGVRRRSILHFPSFTFVVSSMVAMAAASRAPLRCGAFVANDRTSLSFHHRQQQYEKQDEKQQRRKTAALFPSSLHATQDSPAVSSNLYWPSPEEQQTDGLDEANINGDYDGEEDGEQEVTLQSTIFDSIIKIYCTHSEPDFLMPWQKVQQSTSTSSGFIIAEEDSDGGFRIMTNAHSVEYASIIQVQRRGHPQKHRAVVEAIGNDCDLALLKIVDEEGFWGDAPVPALQLGELPDLQDEVDVLGFPTGGDSMSVTSGVVSRIEMQEYTQSGTHLLAIQVDAAINPGNSGGPVVDDHLRVIGVAFQGLDSAENIGYVVPVTVVRHFLQNIRRNDKFTGFCRLGVDLGLIENESFRKSLRMDPHQSGVMVRKLAPTSRAAALDHKLLRRMDVITSLDGIPVANDGKIPFRVGERVSMSCYVQTKFEGEMVAVGVLRDGEEHIIDVPATPSERLVPGHWDDLPPPYVVVGGMVFTPLSLRYLDASSAWSEYVSDNISYLLGQVRQSVEAKGDQVVVLCQVLAHPKNLGYENMADLQLTSVNDQKVTSLRQLQQVLQTCEDEFLTFEFAPSGQLVVLERSELDSITEQVCKEHLIQAPCYMHGTNADSDGDGDVDADVADTVDAGNQ